MAEIIPQINSWVLIAFGVFLMGMEMLTTLLILVFFGIAFAVVGVASFYLNLSGEQQILIAVISGGILTFMLRKPLLKTLQSEDLTLETFEAGETGRLTEHQGELRVNYKGTSWAIQTEAENFSTGDTVIVTEIKNNVATIKPKQ